LFETPPLGVPATGAAVVRGRTPDRRAKLGLTLLWGSVALQAVSAAVFLGVFWGEILGLQTEDLDWAWIELMQVLASVGVVVGLITSVLFLKRSQSRVHSLTRQLEVAAGQFEVHLGQTLVHWSLTEAEKEVALLAIKGFSNSEIAKLRNTAMPTVKSQMTAIFRKSGCTSRQQLISYLVDELLQGVGMSYPPTLGQISGCQTRDRLNSREMTSSGSPRELI
jgi:DNA-binding CsgD family transcriptional regulator